MMDNMFINLTPVEILGSPGSEYQEVLKPATVNINRVMSLHKMDQRYKDRFGGKADEFYATASVQPDTFRPGTQLGAPPKGKRIEMSPGEFSPPISVHWWLTESQYQVIAGDTVR